MTSCCLRMSKWYMITTNCLFAFLGIAFVAFGVMGYRDRFKGAVLFPVITFEFMVILGGVIFVAAIFGILSAYIQRKSLIFVYMAIVLIALVYQIVVGVKLYQKASNPAQYLTIVWSSANTSLRTHLQEEFTCCGFNNAMDNPAITNDCNPHRGPVSSPPCFDDLISYVRSTFSKVYLVVFAALSIEFLALSNAITVLCTSSSDQDDEERRRLRKSGIRLNDMPSTEAKQERGRAHDSYDQYKQTSYGDKYY